LEFRDISRISEAITAKRMKIVPYCQQRNCSPLNLLFGDTIRYDTIEEINVDSKAEYTA